MTELGHLLETFVVGELRKQAAWLDDVGQLGTATRSTLSSSATSVRS